jgi:hypothetical protein
VWGIWPLGPKKRDLTDSVNLSLPLLVIAENVLINGIFLPDVSDILTISQVQMTLITSYKTEIIRQLCFPITVRALHFHTYIVLKPH